MIAMIASNSSTSLSVTTPLRLVWDSMLHPRRLLEPSSRSVFGHFPISSWSVLSSHQCQQSRVYPRKPSSGLCCNKDQLASETLRYQRTTRLSCTSGHSHSPSLALPSRPYPTCQCVATRSLDSPKCYRWPCLFLCRTRMVSCSTNCHIHSLGRTIFGCIVLCSVHLFQMTHFRSAGFSPLPLPPLAHFPLLLPVSVLASAIASGRCFCLSVLFFIDVFTHALRRHDEASIPVIYACIPDVRVLCVVVGVVCSFTGECNLLSPQSSPASECWTYGLSFRVSK